MATGFPVKANYATGDVLTATNMNDLSGTVNYLQYMPPRNPVLNSAMNVWQRGTSISIAASTGYLGVFGADRWGTMTGANQATTISRQATNDTTNLPNIQYCTRFQRNSGQTGTANYNYLQNFETVNSIPFAGKTVTLSFYARAGANFSAASSILTANLYTGTGTDQNAFAGYTGSATPISQNFTLTTTWQRFTVTATLSASMTEMALNFCYVPVGTAGAADYYEITGVQLELGSVANTYMPNQPTYQGELAACQRYYYRITSTGGDAYTHFLTGFTTTTTNFRTVVLLPVPMRIAPSSVDYGGSFLVSDSTTNLTGGAITLQGAGQLSTGLNVAVTGATQFKSYNVFSNNSNSTYIGLNAEL